MIGGARRAHLVIHLLRMRRAPLRLHNFQHVKNFGDEASGREMTLYGEVMCVNFTPPTASCLIISALMLRVSRGSRAHGRTTRDARRYGRAVMRFTWLAGGDGAGVAATVARLGGG